MKNRLDLAVNWFPCLMRLKNRATDQPRYVPILAKRLSWFNNCFDFTVHKKPVFVKLLTQPLLSQIYFKAKQTLNKEQNSSDKVNSWDLHRWHTPSSKTYFFTCKKQNWTILFLLRINILKNQVTYFEQSSFRDHWELHGWTGRNKQCNEAFLFSPKKGSIQQLGAQDNPALTLVQIFWLCPPLHSKNPDLKQKSPSTCMAICRECSKVRSYRTHYFISASFFRSYWFNFSLIKDLPFLFPFDTILFSLSSPFYLESYFQHTRKGTEVCHLISNHTR